MLFKDHSHVVVLVDVNSNTSVIFFFFQLNETLFPGWVIQVYILMKWTWKKRWKYCTLDQLIVKRSKAVWRHRWLIILSLCREYQQLHSLEFYLFLKKITAFFYKLLSECIQTTRYQITQILKHLTISVCHVHMTYECYSCCILAETTLQTDWHFNVLWKFVFSRITWSVSKDKAE